MNWTLRLKDFGWIGKFSQSLTTGYPASDGSMQQTRDMASSVSRYHSPYTATPWIQSPSTALSKPARTNRNSCISVKTYKKKVSILHMKSFLHRYSNVYLLCLFSPVLKLIDYKDNVFIKNYSYILLSYITEKSRIVIRSVIARN